MQGKLLDQFEVKIAYEEYCEKKGQARPTKSLFSFLTANKNWNNSSASNVLKRWHPSLPKTINKLADDLECEPARLVLPEDGQPIAQVKCSQAFGLAFDLVFPPTESDAIFQNLDTEQPATNDLPQNQPIAYLWAPLSTGSFIRISKADPDEELGEIEDRKPTDAAQRNIIHVSYQNTSIHHVNIAFHPQNMCARSIPDGFDQISFFAKALSKTAKEIVTVRMADKGCDQYRLMSGADQRRIRIESGWKRHDISLETTNVRWLGFFPKEGYKDTPWNCITRLVLEFGHDDVDVKGVNSGELLLSEFFFTSSTDEHTDKKVKA